MTASSSLHPHPISLDRVKIQQGFWEERQRINRENTIPAIHKQMDETGRLESWSMQPDPEHRDHSSPRRVVYMFWDSDTGKYLEAIAYSLQRTLILSSGKTC